MARKKPMKKAKVSQATGPQTIDYTTMAVGTITMQWTYKNPDGTKGTGTLRIGKCPKCGRNGEVQPRKWKQKDGTEKVGGFVTHRQRIDNLIPGFPLTVTEDHCEFTTEPTPES